MRKLTALALAVSTAVAAPAAAVAQQAGSTIITSQKSGEVLSDSYIGAEVVARSAEGFEKVGTVSDLVLGPDDKIVGVVVDVGGFLGVAAKPVGLSWGSLSEEQNEDGLLLRSSLSREDLEAAPEFKTLEAQQVETDRQMMGTDKPSTTPGIQ
ncbi:MAG: PRC-barrel domain-containing protein [Kiloniellaceae bacterium]